MPLWNGRKSKIPFCGFMIGTDPPGISDILPYPVFQIFPNSFYHYRLVPISLFPCSLCILIFGWSSGVPFLREVSTWEFWVVEGQPSYQIHFGIAVYLSDLFHSQIKRTHINCQSFYVVCIWQNSARPKTPFWLNHLPPKINMASEDDIDEETESLDREFARLWRAWKTVHEMVQDRVCT